MVTRENLGICCSHVQLGSFPGIALYNNLNYTASTPIADHDQLLKTGNKEEDGDTEECATPREFRDPYHLCYTMMNNFTSRYLTNESDRVPAMLGLVHVFAFALATGDSMHMGTGLRKGDMVLSLLWCRDQRRRKPVRDPLG